MIQPIPSYSNLQKKERKLNDFLHRSRKNQPDIEQASSSTFTMLVPITCKFTIFHLLFALYSNHKCSNIHHSQSHHYKKILQSKCKRISTSILIISANSFQWLFMYTIQLAVFSQNSKIYILFPCTNHSFSTQLKNCLLITQSNKINTLNDYHKPFDDEHLSIISILYTATQPFVFCFGK